MSSKNDIFLYSSKERCFKKISVHLNAANIGMISAGGACVVVLAVVCYIFIRRRQRRQQGEMKFNFY